MASGLTFIQTSDIRIDSNFSQMGAFGQALKSAVLESFETVISLAQKDGIDALLIPGNLFSSSRPDKETVKYVKEKLESMKPVRVFITPGCGDHLCGDSPYITEEWPDNVHIFKDHGFGAVEIPKHNTVIYGLAHTEHCDGSNPFDGFELDNDKYENYTKIIMLCATLADLSLSESGMVAPFKFRDITKHEFNYAALGSFPQIQSFKKKGEETIRACYSGPPQGTSFDQEGEKGVLRVAVFPDKNDINFIPTDRIKLKSLTLNCDGMKDEEEIIEAILPIIKDKNFSKIPARIILTGEVDIDKKINIDIIESSIKKHCLYIKIENRIVPEFDVKAILSDDSVKSAFSRYFIEKINSFDKLPEDENRDSQEEDICRLALRYGLDAFSREEVKKRWL